MNMAWVWVFIPIVAILAGVASTWIRVRHGYPVRGHGGRRGRWHIPEADPSELQTVKAALAKAEGSIANLKERVQVLERIATDRSAELRDQIDRLR
jgi:hypothetical protein